MKSTSKVLGIIALTAIIGFSMSVLSLTGCESPTGGGGNSSGSGGNGGGGGGGNPTIINIAAIQGVTVPTAGGTPVTTITGTEQYSGTVAWAPAVTGTFAAGTAYTATITLTPKTGFTLTGVAANFFVTTIDNAATITGLMKL